MALWICLGCTTAYAVGAPACPQCGSTDHAEEGTEEAEMGKVTRHGGVSRRDTPAEPLPDAAEGELVEREHPGTGEPGEPVEATPDGTEHELTVDEPPAKGRRARKATGRKSG